MTDLKLQDARILIVDDQEANILFLEGLLHEGGYTCGAACSTPAPPRRPAPSFSPT
jgi:CheY-like chemotaxis protein